MGNRRVWLLVGAFGLWGLMGCGGAQSTGTAGETEASCACSQHGDCPCRQGDHAACPCHREGAEHGECACHAGQHGEGHHGEGHHGEHGEGHGEHGEHANLPPALTAFHGVLRPVWHSEPGPARGALACQNAAAFTQHAQAVSAEAPPAGVDASWQAGVDALTQAVSALATECATPAHANAEARLTTMHEAFHALTERVPAGS